MAITVIGNPTVVSNATATTRTVDRPADTQTNDVLVAHITNSGGNTLASWTVPTDWVLVSDMSTQQTNPRFAVYRKIITDIASEPTTYTWSTYGTTNGGSINCGGFRGVDLTTPVDVLGTVVTGTSDITLTGVTTVTDNALLIASIGMNSSSGLWTTPSGWTEFWDNGVQRGNALFYKLQAVAGASGNQLMDDNKGAGAARVGVMWALRPAIAAGGGSLPKGRNHRSGSNLIGR